MTDVRAVGVGVATVWTGPDAPRDVDAPALTAAPDLRAWMAALGTPERLDLHGRVETQALLGETVHVTGQRGDWVRVVLPGQPSSKDPAGYPGWIPVAQLADPPDPPGRGTVTVTAASCSILDAPGGRASIDGVSYGTVLGATGETAGGFIAVSVAGAGRAGWIAKSTVDSAVSQRDADGCTVRTEAARFLGLAYLWGGMSAYGLDCSGLVHLVFRRLGSRLPRDAHDQATAGREVAIDEAQAGDLYFFAEPGRSIHHVAIAAGGGRMLHAPETGRRIELVAIPAQRRRTLRSVRRIIGGA